MDFDNTFSDDDYLKWYRERTLPGQDALPSTHPYLKLLRGEFQGVSNNAEFSSEQSVGGSTSSKRSSANDLETEYNGWRDSVRSKAGQFEVGSALKSYPDHGIEGEKAQVELEGWCNRCLRPLNFSEPLFRCEICGEPGYGYDVCEPCALSGMRCDDPKHELRLWKNVEVKFGRLVPVLANRIHSIPRKDLTPEWLSSTQPLDLQDATLYDVLHAYTRQNVKGPVALQKQFYGTYRWPHEGPDIEENVPLATKQLHVWRLICHFLRLNDLYDPPIRSYLTEEQIGVIRILLEWWTGEIQDVKLTHMAMNGNLVQSIFKATLPGDVEAIRGTPRSHYHQALSSLFQIELLGQPVSSSVLRTYRARAARAAAVQRLGFAYIRQNMIPLWHDPNVNFHQTSQTLLKAMLSTIYPGLVVCESQNSLETYRFAFEFIRTCQEALSLFEANLRVAEQLFTPKTLKATIRPCSWISEVKHIKNFPCYLWDKKSRKTVHTDDIPYVPEYTVISHTWGRWKTPNAEVELAGVPWKIPENSRFPVNDLEDILEKVPGSNRYLWFDLVCIPQITNNPNLKKIQREEIGKQASIFAHAKAAIIWFSNMKEFGPLEDICHILAMNATRYPGPFGPLYIQDRLVKIFNSYRNLWFEESVPLGRSGAKADGILIWNEYLDEWFTSLWTLQEVCMRPDMWLCTRDWQPLKSSMTGTPIPLDCLLALIRANIRLFPLLKNPPPLKQTYATEALLGLELKEHETQDGYNLFKNLPPCLHAFLAYFQAAGLVEIPGIERIRIILMGNQRYCKERRAEAIMAALDATDWFNTQTSKPNSVDPLVLDRYPLSFINEVREKVGDIEFFDTNYARDFWTKIDLNDVFETQITALDVKGTFLPFSSTETVRLARDGGSWVSLPHVQTEVHPSTATWQVEVDGSITVAKACVLISSSLKHEQLNLGPVQVVDFHVISSSRAAGIPAETTTKEDLSTWVSSRKYVCHVVAIQRLVEAHSSSSDATLKNFGFSGVIFRELASNLMMKIGSFRTRWVEPVDYGWSKQEVLNWKVL